MTAVSALVHVTKGCEGALVLTKFRRVDVARLCDLVDVHAPIWVAPLEDHLGHMRLDRHADARRDMELDANIIAIPDQQRSRTGVALMHHCSLDSGARAAAHLPRARA